MPSGRENAVNFNTVRLTNFLFLQLKILLA